MSSNTVVLSQAQVHKRYRSRIAHDHELLFLTALAQSGLTPEILSQTQHSITLAAIKDHTLLEALAVWSGHAPPEDGRRLLGLLVRWLCEVQRHFAKETGRIAALEDPNLCNLLVAPCGGLVGLDFECWHDGTPEETPAMERIRTLNGQLELRSQLLSETFGRFLSDEIVRQLLDTPDGLMLGGKKRTLTIYSSLTFY